MCTKKKKRKRVRKKYYIKSKLKEKYEVIKSERKIKVATKTIK